MTKQKKIDPSSGKVVHETLFGNSGSGDKSVDGFGHNLAMTVRGPDFEAQTSLISYDTTGRYIVSSTNPVGHTAKFNYYPDNDSRSGLVHKIIDPNGNETKYDYDSFRRIKQVIEYSQSDEPLVYRQERSWCRGGQSCPFGNNAAVWFITRYTDGVGWHREYFDKRGRVIREQHVGFRGTLVNTDREFDKLGRLVGIVGPYYSGQGGQLRPKTLYKYDKLGRIILMQTPDNSVSTVQYLGPKVVRTDAGRETTIIRNEMGKIESVTKANVPVTFSYNGFGALTKAVSAGSEFTIEYDALGRAVVTQTPNQGKIQYTRNGLNQILTEKGELGKTTCFAYDRIGRLVKRVHEFSGTVSNQIGQVSDASQSCAGTAQPENVATWIYDTASHGIGHKSMVKMGGYTQQYFYDKLSRLEKIETDIQGETFSYGYKYNDHHVLSSTQYPGVQNALKVSYSYDHSGYLSAIRNADSGELYFEVQDMDAYGTVSDQLHGNGTRTVRKLDPITRKITEKTYQPSGIIADQRIVYDATGNVSTHEDIVGGWKNEYGFDELNRLEKMIAYMGDAIQNSQVTYNPAGNIMTKTGVGSYQYGGTCDGVRAGPHAVTSIEGVSAKRYCYDKAGNLVAGDGRSIIYGNFRKPVKIIKGGTSVEFTYGPEGNRYARFDSTSAGMVSKTYIGARYEKVVQPDGTIHELHYVGPNVLVIVSDRGTPSEQTEVIYAHKDHLGSAMMVTDRGGRIVGQWSFDPWGMRTRLGTHTASPYRGFTGHEQLDSIGLIHMNARLYDPKIGRFLSPDPVVGNSLNAQFYNGYSYVINNPVTFTDPSGNCGPVCVGLIAAGVGLIVGSYTGGAIANNELRPWEWDWSSDRTWAGIAIGGVVGTVLGAWVGVEVATGAMVIEFGPVVMTGGGASEVIPLVMIGAGVGGAGAGATKIGIELTKPSTTSSGSSSGSGYRSRGGYNVTTSVSVGRGVPEHVGSNVEGNSGRWVPITPGSPILVQEGSQFIQRAPARKKGLFETIDEEEPTWFYFIPYVGDAAQASVGALRLASSEDPITGEPTSTSQVLKGLSDIGLGALPNIVDVAKAGWKTHQAYKALRNEMMEETGERFVNDYIYRQSKKWDTWVDANPSQREFILDIERFIFENVD